MKRPVLLLLLGACVLWAALPTFAQPAAEGLPKVGSRWKYSFRDQQYRTPARLFTVEVAEVEGAQVRELLYVEGGDISQTVIDANKFRFLARPVGGSSVLVELAPYSGELYGKAPLAPTDYPGGLNSIWTIPAPVYAEERISVPAGVFRTLRVEVSGSAPAFGASSSMAQTPARFEYTAWYSSELHRYVRIRHRMWNRWNVPIGDELVQLVSYERGG